MNSARRFTIRGRVQGVGFRYFVMQAARELGVTGTVRNAQDGSVEVVAQGTEPALIALRTALERGPAHAYVAEVQELQLDAAGVYVGFRVVY